MHLWLASVLVLAQAPQEAASWVDSPEHLATVQEFLVSRAKAWEVAWETSFPGPIGWSEWGENSSGAVAWSGVYNGRKLRAEYTVYGEGVDRESAEKGALGHRAVLICSGQRWMVVERAIPDERGAPWSAVVGSKCPSVHWESTMLASLLRPLYGLSVSRYLEQHPLIRCKESSDVIEVQLAASDDVAKFLAEGRLKLIHGMLGVSVAFTRASGWRPTVIREVHTLDSLDDSGRAGMERHTFGGVDAMVLRTYQWSQWAKLAQLMIPTQREADLRVRIDTAGLVPHRHTSRATMKAELLASPPDSSAFELAPPDWMGPVGRVNNADTGVVEVYDSRGLAERLDSRGQFVSLLSEAAKKSHYQPAGDSMPWYSAAFLWGGCVSLMCCFWQLATRRRGSAV